MEHPNWNINQEELKEMRDFIAQLFFGAIGGGINYYTGLVVIALVTSNVFTYGSLGAIVGTIYTTLYGKNAKNKLSFVAQCKISLAIGTIFPVVLSSIISIANSSFQVSKLTNQLQQTQENSVEILGDLGTSEENPDDQIKIINSIAEIGKDEPEKAIEEIEEIKGTTKAKEVKKKATDAIAEINSEINSEIKDDI